MRGGAGGATRLDRRAPPAVDFRREPHRPIAGRDRSHSPYRTGATAAFARSRDFPKIRTSPPRRRPLRLLALPLLCGALAAAAPAPPADGSPAKDAAARTARPAPPPLPPAPRVLAAARARLDGYETISATLSQTVAVGPARYAAAGTLAADRSGRVRVELTSDDGPDLLQICDGELLHTQYTLGDTVSVTRRNVRAVRDAAAGTTNPPLAAALGLGGLSGVLGTLEADMKWRPARRDVVNGADFIVLDGRWTSASRKSLNVRFGGNVPAFVPDGAKVYLTADRLLPRRIVYWAKGETDDAPRRTLMTLDVADVRIDEPLPPDLFTYALPADADEDDVTAKAVARLAALGAPGEEENAEPAGGDGVGEGGAGE